MSVKAYVCSYSDCTLFICVCIWFAHLIQYSHKEFFFFFLPFLLHKELKQYLVSLGLFAVLKEMGRFHDDGG